MILMIKSISSSALFHTSSWIVGFIPFSLLFLETEAVIISRVPMRIHFHVFLTLTSSFFVILGLLFTRQIVPPSTQDLIDGSRLFKRTFGLHHGTHLFHVKHKRVQRFLDVILFLFGLFFVVVVSVVTRRGMVTWRQSSIEVRLDMR